MRKFRRRRQRAGFALLAALAVVVSAGGMRFGLGLARTGLAAVAEGDEAAVQRVEPPSVDAGPKAAAVEKPAEDARVDEKAATQGEKAATEDKQAEEQASSGQEKARDEGGGDDGNEASAEQKESEQAAAKPEIPTPATNDLWMDIPALGLNDNYIANSNSPAALDVGATKTVESGFPWEGGANTYISAHRLGYPGTASDYQFYNLPNLAMGDKIYLYDENLTVYTYEVTGFAEVDPSETWVTAPQAGRDMISLMTCIENYGDYWTMGPNWYVRYVVQADRVSVDPA